MALLKMQRRTANAVEVREVRKQGRDESYWCNKRLPADPDDPNQAPWIVFSVTTGGKPPRRCVRETEYDYMHRLLKAGWDIETVAKRTGFPVESVEHVWRTNWHA